MTTKALHKKAKNQLEALERIDGKLDGIDEKLDRIAGTLEGMCEILDDIRVSLAAGRLRRV